MEFPCPVVWSYKEERTPIFLFFSKTIQSMLQYGYNKDYD